jgi:lipopolysaccharide/colanic/teichoic acid biosynthesis glycosyltransferase
MYADSEGYGLALTIGDDARITSVGKYLRRWKLDEIPQLLNVIKGEMSLVGPRPEVPDYVSYYSARQQEILAIKPGITDLASLRFIQEGQLLACQPDPETYYIQRILPHKLKLNAIYLKKANLVLDTMILIKTISTLLRLLKPSVQSIASFGKLRRS